MGEAAGRPELAVADAVDPDLDLPSYCFRDSWRDLPAMTAGSLISAPASGPGISSQLLGGGSRPTCEVLIRLMLLCMSPSSLVRLRAIQSMMIRLT